MVMLLRLVSLFPFGLQQLLLVMLVLLVLLDHLRNALALFQLRFVRHLHRIILFLIFVITWCLAFSNWLIKTVIHVTATAICASVKWWYVPLISSKAASAYTSLFFNRPVLHTSLGTQYPWAFLPYLHL